VLRDRYPSFRIYLYKVRNIRCEEKQFYIIDILFYRSCKPSGCRVLINFSKLLESDVFRIYSSLKKLSEKYGSRVLSIIPCINAICKLDKEQNGIKTALEDFGFSLKNRGIADIKPLSLAYYIKKKAIKIYTLEK